MKPEIDVGKDMAEIVKDLKKHKNIKQWTDEDGQERFNQEGKSKRFKIVTKAKIKEILTEWN